MSSQNTMTKQDDLIFYGRGTANMRSPHSHLVHIKDFIKKQPLCGQKLKDYFHKFPMYLSEDFRRCQKCLEIYKAMIK